MVQLGKQEKVNLYDRDFVLWCETTVKQLQGGDFEDLDLVNLIEEVASLGRSEKNSVESLVIQIIHHLLLYQYWSNERGYSGKHWEIEIIAFRTQLELRLTKTLSNYLESKLEYLYQKGKKIAQVKSGLDLPDINPYTLTQIIDEDWLPVQEINYDPNQSYN